MRCIPTLTIVLVQLGCASIALPPESVSHNRRGTEHLSQDRLDEAEASFLLALEYHPRFSEPRANLGVVALRRGDLEVAERHLRDAIELNEDFALAWANLGVVLDRQGRSGQAREAYEQALRIDPGIVPARRNLAFLLAHRSEYVSARAHLMRLRELAPDHAEVHATLAYCEWRLGRARAARGRAEHALLLDPESALARAVRGMLFAHAGDLDAAITDLRMATRDGRVGRMARVRLAAVLVLRGEFREARAIIEELRVEDPEDPALDLIEQRLASMAH